MLDEMNEKRGMIKLLLDMLKHSAADEVGNGMKKPEGMPDGKGLEIEKVSVLPHDEHEEAEPVSPESASLADEVMSHGEPKEMPHDDAEEKAMEHGDGQDSEMEDSPMPAFASLMGRKKGKK